MSEEVEVEVEYVVQREVLPGLWASGSSYPELDWAMRSLREGDRIVKITTTHEVLE